MTGQQRARETNGTMQGNNGTGREIVMAEQVKFVVVTGRKPVSRAAEQMKMAGALREATTGRMVTLPRVWAVAAMPTERPARVQERPQGAAETDGRAVPEAELGFYRKYTEALLRRYVQMTMEAGRVPSLMGREVIGGKASSYRIHGFDDAVIFRLDVERCLKQLDDKEREVIRRVGIQEYTQGEAAALMGVSLRTVVTRYADAMDRLTGILLRTRLLEPMKGCQGVRSARRRVSA